MLYQPPFAIMLGEFLSASFEATPSILNDACIRRESEANHLMPDADPDENGIHIFLGSSEKMTMNAGQESRRQVCFEKDLRISLPGLGRRAHAKRVRSRPRQSISNP